MACTVTCTYYTPMHMSWILDGAMPERLMTASKTQLSRSSGNVSYINIKIGISTTLYYNNKYFLKTSMILQANYDIAQESVIH